MSHDASNRMTKPQFKEQKDPSKIFLIIKYKTPACFCMARKKKLNEMHQLSENQTETYTGI